MKNLRIIVVLKKKLLLVDLKKAYFLYAVLVMLLCISCYCILNYYKIQYTSSNTGLRDTDIKTGKLAIIIDDFGSDRNGVKEMMNIDRHLTFAVMPFLTFSQSDAQTAHERGFEVIVHLAMEPNKGKISWLGPRPILSVMRGEEVESIVRDAFDSVPYAKGANNHMGSKASGDEAIISSVLDIIKEKGLYFVDSCTSSRPIAKKVAAAKEILCYDRDVFLDGQKPKSFVKERLRKAGEIALRKGQAVAIGHVGMEGGKVTAQAIAEMLPEFDEKNIQLVYVSELGN
ncbi:MAG: divergent polysaccharide deacetylase family protein [Clostridia bacterium]|nr:divergent polysaccharide deacetylase family protein [Clostridia bacterium]